MISSLDLFLPGGQLNATGKHESQWRLIRDRRLDKSINAAVITNEGVQFTLLKINYVFLSVYQVDHLEI